MKLGDVMTLSKGNLISIEDDKEYIIAGVQNYGAGILNKRKVKGFELNMKKYQIIKPNQLMWCKVDTKNGAFGITKPEHTNSLASTNMALADIDTSKCHPEFIEYLFRISFFHEIITKASSGTTNRKYLTPTQLFENIEIPDFNKNEQLKWLEKVDSIINSGITSELTHQLNLVKKLRQQLLQDAVQGKLVEQNATDESASVLLKKIKTEKEKLIAEKKLKKEKELPPIKPEEIPFEIPENWVWCKIGELTTSIVPNRDKPLSFTGNIYWITQANFSDDNYALNYNLTGIGLSREEVKKYNCRVMPIGSLIMSCVGQFDLVCLIEKEIVANQQLHCFVPYGNVEPMYLCYAVKYFSKLIEKEAIQTTIKYINKTKCESILIALPPLEEQKRIVQKLDELMQYCNELEANIKQSQAQNEKLLQQVLREALRVPTEKTEKEKVKI